MSMEPIDITPTIEEERPQLYMELQWRKVTEVWKLNDTPTGPNSDNLGKRTWILLARGENNDYIILSRAGTKSSPDKYQTWVHYGGGLDAGAQQEHENGKIRSQQGQERDLDGYVLIDKRKLGRPRRELTAEEVQEIRGRHEAGEGIGRIAAALHLGTRRVMEALKD